MITIKRDAAATITNKKDFRINDVFEDFPPKKPYLRPKIPLLEGDAGGKLWMLLHKHPENVSALGHAKEILLFGLSVHAMWSVAPRRAAAGGV